MRPNRRTEAEVSPIIAAWLASRGYTTYAEVPIRGGAIDLVGLRGEGAQRRSVAVEIKQTLGRAVVRQAMRSAWACDETWVCVMAQPRAINTAFKLAVDSAVGILRVTPDDRIEILYEPFELRRVSISRAAYDKLWTRAKRKGTSVVGGRASRDHAPARDVYHKVVAMRRADPNVTWAAMYDAIPNHYASARSMKQSMEKYEKFHPGAADEIDDIPV